MFRLRNVKIVPGVKGMVKFSQMAVPQGLKLIPHYVDGSTHKIDEMVKCSLLLDKVLAENIKHSMPEKTTSYLSKQHNVSTDVYLRKLSFEFDGSVIQCQHFECYGEDGHQLTYFIGNTNIPQYVKENLITQLETLPEVQQLKNSKPHQILTWNFTLNTYRKSPLKPNMLPGFPFYIDIPSNGDITFVYPLLSSAVVEMKHVLPENTSDLPSRTTATDTVDNKTAQRREGEEGGATFQDTLHTGTLLMLSGPSRWEWQHRVLPQQISLPESLDDAKGETCEDRGDCGTIYRMSLVLGCSTTTGTRAAVPEKQ